MNRLKKTATADSGLTLIELMLAIAIGAIVITVTLNFLQLGQEIFRRSQNQIDAQNQLRMAMYQLKRELSAAKNVQIITTVPPAFDEGSSYFYVLNNTLVLKKGTADPQASPGSLSLPGLLITFSKAPQGGKVVRVSMITTDGTKLESDVFVPNNVAAEIGGSMIGNTILFETVDKK